ncbi:MAG: PAS domain-containing protein [Alkalilacustris sp.]
MTAPATLRPADPAELPLAIEELFVSRTDERGVIACGNAVFRRMSGFGWDKLIGAPHKLIRHPDMPSGVFEYFWSELKAGHKVGAYVKNRAADGRHYWVFAVAMPTDGGFVSVRIKPTSALLDNMRAHYATLRRREAEEGLSPEASRDAFLAMLHADGFASYQSFMAQAVLEEFTTRCTALDRPLDPRVKRGQTLRSAIGTARENAAQITRLFDEIRGVPTNIRILAAQLERGGGPIGVISTNHTTLSEEMLTGVNDFRTAADRTARAIEDGVFRSCAAALIQEVTTIYQTETDRAPNLDIQGETRLLQHLAAQCVTESDAAMATIATQAEQFAKVAKGVKRHVAGLDVTRIMCKIENARLGDTTSGLSEIIDTLEEVQARIAVQLAEIERASGAILGGTRRAGLGHVA